MPTRRIKLLDDDYDDAYDDEVSDADYAEFADYIDNVFTVDSQLTFDFYDAENNPVLTKRNY